MAKLIQKSGYIKTGAAAGYMEYIATREGVEKLNGSGAATGNQKKLIDDLLRDFPDTEELFEYRDYLAAPTFGNASAFITMALDTNAHTISKGDGYMKYIATRPRAERRGEHGLFSSESAVSLDAALKEVQAHDGAVWTLIYSLRREDAARLGYDNAAAWRQLILSHQTELAVAMKIPTEQFRWYAAFHDEGHHPHIHMMAWSEDSRQGFLTTDGIASMRSVLTTDIFRDELYSLYEKKDISYKEVTNAARSAMAELVRQMESSICDSPIIEQKMSALAEALKTVTGKKVYGYMKKPVKMQVDEIVDELAKLPAVAECYAVWNRLQDELEGYYKSKPHEHLPLSQQKEFRAIKNAVIREAENIRLGTVSFEDENMDDEPDEQEESHTHSGSRPLYKMAAEYRAAKAILYDEGLSPEEKQKAMLTLEHLWSKDFTAAAHQLGKCWRDGLCDLPDEEKAAEWFLRSAEAGNAYSKYALGKLLQDQKRIEEAAAWYEKAAAQGNRYANYRLGKLYLTGGENIPKDIAKALDYLTASADAGNQYAQYTLGKLYLMGREMERDREKAKEYLSTSAAQGNEYAEFFLDRFEQYRDPSVMLAATKLLHHMSRIFRQNTAPTNPAGIRMDSKRRKKLLQKRLAMGHKADDHEEQISWHNF